MSGACRIFLRNRDGATAVEFALIATPFLALLFAIFQTAMVFWSTQVLETAVANASRQIYTEQFKNLPQNAGLDPTISADAAKLQQNFKQVLCNNVKGLFDCNAMVAIDVRVFGTFASATPTSPVSNGVYNPSGYTFQMPGRNQIVVVRASMEYPTLTMLNPVTGLKDGNQLIMASAAFLTEP